MNDKTNKTLKSCNHDCCCCHCQNGKGSQQQEADSSEKGSIKQLLSSVYQKIKPFTPFFIGASLYGLNKLNDRLPETRKVDKDKFATFLEAFSVFGRTLGNNEDSPYAALAKGRDIYNYFESGIADFERSKDSSYREKFRKVVRSLNSFTFVEDDEGFLNSFFSIMIPAAKKKTEICSISFDSCMLYEFEISNKAVSICVLEKSVVDSYMKDQYRNYYGIKGGTIEELLNIIYEAVNSERIFITYLRNQNCLKVMPIQSTEAEKNYFINEKFATEILEETNKFQKINSQRSYLLLGEPGTGKTTFALKIAELSERKRIVRIDSSVIIELNQEVFRALFNNLKCDFLLIDDIDRLTNSSDTAFLLSQVENLKNLKNNFVFFATTNSISKMDKALLRPGRFDEVIEFKLPNLAERKTLIRKLLNSYGVNLDLEKIEKLAKLTDRMSQAFIKEYCSQLRVWGIENFEKTCEKIKLRKGLMNLAKEHDYSEEEDPDSPG